LFAAATAFGAAAPATAAAANAEPEGPHFLTHWITKVAGSEGHYVLRVPEVFVLLKTRGG